MGYASKLGRARINARNPRAAGQCDRCGFIYNHINLSWQYDWAGASLINKRILVCEQCNDVPQSQLRAIVVPADPVPIQNPRVTDYRLAETNLRTTQGNTVDPRTGIPVIGGDTRLTNPTGLPVPQTGDLLLEDNVYYLVQEDGFLLNLETNTTIAPAEYLRVTQQTGEPNGGLNPTPGTDPNAPGNSDPGLPYDNVVVPNTGQE